MMNCVTAKGKLSSYIDENLDPEDQSQIEQHLYGCPECNQVFSDVRYLTERLRNTGSLKTSPEFDRTLRMRIVNSPSDQKPIVTFRNLSYGLSGAALVVAISFIVITNVSSPEDLQSPADPSRTTSVQQQYASPVRTPAGSPEKEAFTGTTSTQDSLKNRPEKVDQERIKLVEQEKQP